jgi:nucleotide-binding universal stress UspA family protein
MAGRIVVGIDEGPHAAAALRWAVEEAALRDATVEAVHAWRFVPMPTAPDAAVAPLAWTADTDILEATRETAERVAREQVREVVGDDGENVTISVVEGEAADVLVAAAEGADLLVVGNRGRGHLAQALFGSVSARVSDKAHCPVVVVHTTAS